MIKIIFLLIASGMIYEGIGFLFPQWTKNTMNKILNLSNGDLRKYGILLIGTGMLIFYIYL